MSRLLLVSSILFSLSCFDPNAHASRIVRLVEQSGAGDLSSTTPPELVRWFAQQPPQFVASIDSQCAPLRRAATANWSYRTAEGRVCTAAAQIAPMASPQFQADQRAY